MIPAAPALACSCIGPTIFSAYRGHDEVFPGRVLSVVLDRTGEYPREFARIGVTATFKGAASGKVEILKVSSASPGVVYQTDGALTSWVKVKNPTHSQTEGRAELFEHRRGPEPRPRRKAVPPVLALG